MDAGCSKVDRKSSGTHTDPALTFPIEIVAEIFLCFLPVYPLCPPLTGMFSPSLLARICRRWREIALATPTLWRAIEFSDQRAYVERQAHIVDIWLTRSRCCPLSIRIHMVRGYPGGALPDIRPLLSHQGRFEYLQLRRVFGNQPSLVEFEGPMPLLRGLDLVTHNPIPCTCPDAPLLRTLVLGALYTQVTFPWAQLTSLTVDSVIAHQWTPLLQQTSNLVYGNFALFDVPHEPHQGPYKGPDIVVPYLESLILRNPGPPPVIVCLTGLFVPALRRLEIPERVLGANPIDSLASFVAKSGDKLEQIRITGKRVFFQARYRRALPSNVAISFDLEDLELGGGPD
ncbi:hypothetical protein K438DRAFT_1818860 [Mycena galopus ATCC 62051]|nr:hypothetical protein K438DRAFT_1818860 [Mycena galopus ATCC 62051]